MAEAEQAFPQAEQQPSLKRSPSLRTVHALEKNIKINEARHQVVVLDEAIGSKYKTRIGYFPADDDKGRSYTEIVILDEDKEDRSTLRTASGIVIRRSDKDVTAYRVKSTMEYIKDATYDIWYPIKSSRRYTMVDGEVTDKEVQSINKRLNAQNKKDGHKERAERREKHKTTLKYRLGQATRAATLAAVVAASAKAGIGTLPLINEFKDQQKSTSIEKIVYPAGSLEAEIEALRHDPQVDNKRNTIDLTTLYYTNDTFQVLTNPADNRPVADVQVGSKQLFEVYYDKVTKSLRTRGGEDKLLGKNLTYQLFSPIVDNVAVRTALTTGSVDRVVVRLLEQPNEYNTEEAFTLNGKYESEDRTEPSRGSLKTVFIFLPSTVSTAEYTNVVGHEPLHAVASKSALSGYNDEKPTDKDYGAWTQVCSAIRDIAVDDAEKQMSASLALMEESASLFEDPVIRDSFMEVRDALQRGDFNKLQPEKVTSDFSRKVPACDVIGPGKAFLKLVHEKGINYEITSEAVQDLLNQLDVQWSKVLKADTIYRGLNEGAYLVTEGAHTDSAGHSYQGWDEIAASIPNLLLLYPGKLGDYINRLPEEERPAAVKLVSYSFVTMDALVPAQQKAFHTEFRESYQRFDKAIKSAI